MCPHEHRVDMEYSIPNTKYRIHNTDSHSHSHHKQSKSNQIEIWVDTEYRILISGDVSYRRLPVYRNTGQLLNSEQLILTELNICETTDIANYLWAKFTQTLGGYGSNCEGRSEFNVENGT